MGATITLPEANSAEGAEVRLLLAECRSPAFSSYSQEAATESMQLMDAVLRNRLLSPKEYMAKGATTIVDIIKARGQFAGFERYPSLETSVKARIDDLVEIANTKSDARHSAYATHVQKAIEIAKLTKYSDPSPGKVVGWRTSNRGAPGPSFIFYKRVLGNDFYYRK
jgi:hypothetical protein